MEFAPAFPIIQISTDLILAAMDHTPADAAKIGANTSLASRNGSINSFSNRDTTPAMLNPLVKRDAEPCSANLPCPDKR